jgi:hypothetical protein
MKPSRLLKSEIPYQNLKHLKHVDFFPMMYATICLPIGMPSASIDCIGRSLLSIQSREWMGMVWGANPLFSISFGCGIVGSARDEHEKSSGIRHS